MERFKAVEKEMKTKAFSKEGLIAAAQMTPEQRAKAELTTWLSNQVDELSRQIESSEAELEQLQSTGKKGKKGGASGKDERRAQLDTLNERRNWHVSRIEILLRLIENDQLETERVAEIKEDISYFVESNAEEDFEEDDGIYDEFNLDQEEEAFGLKDNDDVNSSHDGASVVASEEPPASVTSRGKRRDSEDASVISNSAPVKALTESAAASPVAASKKPPPAVKKTSTGPAAASSPAAPPAAASAAPASAPPVTASPSAPKEEKVTIPPANFNNRSSAPPQSPIVAAASPQGAGPAGALSPTKPGGPGAALPPIRYAAAAAAAVAGQQVPPSAAPSSVFSPPPTAGIEQSDSEVAGPAAVGSAEDARVSPAPGLGTAASGEATAAPGGPTAAAPQYNLPPNLANGSNRNSPMLAHRNAANHAQASPSPSHASAVPTGAPPGIAPPLSYQQQQQQQHLQHQQQHPTEQSPLPPGTLSSGSAAAAAVQPTGGADTPAQQQAAQRRQGTEGARLPSSLSDLVTSFESAKQKSLLGENNLAQVHKSLEASYMNIPEPLDTEKPKYYVPKNAYPTAPHYPQQPSPIFDNPALYAKLDVDTLFYIFYYQQGTYHQYLAAKELKKQSWRFHKQYLTWFQRHSEPHAITDEYEQGVYVYFDWEGSWCQRKKSDFRSVFLPDMLRPTRHSSSLIADTSPRLQIRISLPRRARVRRRQGSGHPFLIFATLLRCTFGSCSENPFVALRKAVVRVCASLIHTNEAMPSDISRKRQESEKLESANDG